MIQKLWLYPPMAIARLGPSETPCESFRWGPNDLHPRGTGKTTIQSAETLRVSPDGTITSYIPTEIRFKDNAGFKPVCPFFELHAEWEAADGNVQRGPITPQILDLFDLKPQDIRWKVEVANLKPYHFTLNSEDRITATVEITGDITQRQELRGISPPDPGGSPEDRQPLIPEGEYLPLGWIQLTKPTDEFPEFRLRFTPAKGLVYGPPNLPERLFLLNIGLVFQGDLEQGTLSPDFRSEFENRQISLSPNNLITITTEVPNNQWRILDRGQDRTYIAIKESGTLGIYNRIGYELPTTDLMLNPRAAWCQFFPTNEDPRTNPGGLYATVQNVSLGLVDDVCDGIISCWIDGVPPAFARVTVGPPDYAPDRRTITSLADGLADRVRRQEVDVDDMELTTLEINDLMERALETMELMNLDAQNDRIRGENRALAIQQGIQPDVSVAKTFPRIEPVLGRPLPLTEYGRQNHRRFVSLEVFEDILREQPDLIEQWIREPVTADKYYDQRMPALMRGSDRYPMHITRRQYNLLVAWIQRLRRDVESGS